MGCVVANDPKLLAAIEAQVWKMTTYLENHEYIVRKWNPDLFTLIATLIDDHGYRGTFMKMSSKYLDIGPYRYWHYTLILNRADNRVPSKYFKRV
jgi:hypothetical protein